ncbi:PAS domain-containing sensor histidine kinase [SAR92 clade bacterium H231]|nr:PAS domain-containing sensor histidine kinase [SAR92 clade bacterium H231]
MVPPGSIDRQHIETDQGNKPRLLRIYISYRLLLSVLFLALTHFQLASDYLRTSNQQLFSLTIVLYSIINVVTALVFYRQRWRPSETALFAMLLIDTIAITSMMHASDSPDGSLGYLLMVTVAASGIFQRGVLALALAAIASFILISISLTAFFSGTGTQAEVISSGIFSTLLFATAMVFVFLARRLSLAQQLAFTESRIALQLQRLNDLVINRMRTGILVFDRDYRIEQLNERACMLLGQTDDNRLLARNDSLTKLPELVSCHRDWLANPRLQLASYRAPGSNIPLQISFSQVIGEDQQDCILFLEDARTIAQQSQQLKNNSLGQLTASIAHEIRNPLGAISHAAQLLDESQLDAQNHRLVEVILRHAKRVNRLIQNIMQLSQQKTPDIKVVDIFQACEQSKAQIEESAEFDRPVILLHRPKQKLVAPFDASQLQQVITNLLTNALRHSQKSTGTAWASIEFSLQEELSLPSVKIFDQGPGVGERDCEKIFEPFYTTEKTGTGLGLYIARGLCEINFATLSYIYKRHSRGYFQILFSDPAKQLPGNPIHG